MNLENNEHEFDLRNVKWRMLSLIDMKEFKAAAQESIESNYEFLAYGEIFDNISPSEFLFTYYQMLFKDPVDHYGLFDGGKLLGHISFGVCFGQFGAEVIGWVRKDFHNKGVGELGLAYAEEIAFRRKKFNFMALHINQKNKASRRVAEKAGFKPVLKMAYNIGSPECSVLYIKVSPRIVKLARQYGRRPLDVMNTPAGMSGMGHYLLSDSVVEFFAWPFPPFHEDSKPVNAFAFDDFTGRINLNPKNFEPIKDDE